MSLETALKLIAITDGMDGGRGDLAERVVAAVRGGATSVQIRLKNETAREIVSVTREIVARVDVPVIVNDRFDIAVIAGAAGVHLGADDIAPSLVRRHVPPGFIIGASAGTIAELMLADGADYVGAGPIYVTESKRDAGDAIGVEGLSRLISIARAPIVAIGGIDSTSAMEPIRAGAAGVAVISAIFGSDDPESAARLLCRAIGI